MSAERAARAALLERWQTEGDIAHIHGWDFSHIEGRYTEETDLPWSYEQTVRRYLTPEARLLDVDTGGGEFLLSLGHPHRNTAAMENYPPNIALCRRTFAPLDVEFRLGSGKGPYPFPDGAFDLVINRHGDFSAAETGRVLRPGGVFGTEQVGAVDARELGTLLLGSRSWTDRNASAPSAFLTWELWCGSPGSSSGSSPAFRWSAAPTAC